MAGTKEIALSDAALRLGKSWERTWRLVLKGALTGRKKDGRWVVTEESVEAMIRSTTADEKQR